MSIHAMIAHNVVNPTSGKTVREENLKITHDFETYPVGRLVEIDCECVPMLHGCRVRIANYDRDCDGTPLYSVTIHEDWCDPIKCEWGIGVHWSAVARFQTSGGFSASNLKPV